MLEQKRIDEIRQAGIDAGFGHNTHDLMRRYAKDIKALLDDRQELLDRIIDIEGRLMVEQDRSKNLDAQLEASNMAEEVDG